MKHNFIISIYKKSEIHLVDFHIKTICKIKPKKNIIFNIVVNPELYDYAIHYLSKSKVIEINIINGVTSFFTPYDEGSYHHSANLTFALDMIQHENEIVTFIDPDFFFIEENFSDINYFHYTYFIHSVHEF